MTRSKTENLYRQLRHAILTGDLPPAGPLPSSELQRRFGAGLTPIREALTRLGAERLTVGTHNRGYRVAPVSSADLADLARVRGLLERDMVLSSIAAADADYEARVVAAHHRLGRTAPPGPLSTPHELDRWDDSHDAFHAALRSGCASPWAEHFNEQVAVQLKRYHRWIMARAFAESRACAGFRDEMAAVLADVLSLGHHTALMEAALDRDMARAERLLKAHIQLSLTAFLRLARRVGLDDLHHVQLAGAAQ
jgi:DNA-binding GntR family transcriptional regulator